MHLNFIPIKLLSDDNLQGTSQATRILQRSSDLKIYFFWGGVEQRIFSTNNMAYIYQNFVLSLDKEELISMREKGNALTNY